MGLGCIVCGLLFSIIYLMDFLYLQRGWEKTFHFSNKMLGYIRRSTFNIREPVAIRRTLYLSLVRSHLGYAHMSPKYGRPIVIF